MRQVLLERLGVGWTRAAGIAWWPVDSVATSYLLATGLLIAWHRTLVPVAPALLSLHLLAILTVFALARATRNRPHPILWWFRHWYPLLYIAASYREMAILIQCIRRLDYDAVMARWDLWLWGVYPTVWFERFYHPWLTEILQLTYTLFFFVVIGVGWLLWRKSNLQEFRYYSFLVTLGFLASYIGYFLVPVRGPRFLLAGLHRLPLEGLWLSSTLRHTLDVLESTHFDCFPSGHVALTLIACWGARRLARHLAWACGFYAVTMTFSTVYLRYHYTVDLIAGALLAAILLVAGPRLYGERRHS